MRRTLKIVAIGLSLLAMSCTKNDIDSAKGVNPGFGFKIINTKAGASPSCLMIKLNPDADISSFTVPAGVKSISPVFNSVPGKEEMERRFGLDRWFVLEFDENSDIDAIASCAASSKAVRAVEFDSGLIMDSQDGVYACSNTVTRAADLPFNDEYLSDQWHYYNKGDKVFATNCVAGADINVREVWSKFTGGDPSIIVAVIDEGVKYDHPDLAANMWVNEDEIPNNGIDDDGNGYVDDIHGYNFADRTPEITWGLPGDVGHGTHTAGTVAAVNNNGIGVCGVAGGTGNGDGCRIMSCQIFTRGAGSYASSEAKAVKYAADNGASIISCSFGYGGKIETDNDYLRNNEVMYDALSYFEATKNNDVLDGGIAVFSSGNESDPFCHYPGAIHNIISVSAIAADMLPAHYTNYGPGCNIAAPGGEYCVCPSIKGCVLSTIPYEVESEFDGKRQTGFNYGYMQGTSMACPHVSGVVALGLSYARKIGRKFSREEFKQLVLSSTNDIDQRIAGIASKTFEKTYFTIDGDRYFYNPPQSMQLSSYYHNMGTGLIDAWRLMMAIEGTPCLTSAIGEKQWLSLDSIFGSSSVSLTYLSVDVPQSTIDALGLQPVVSKKTSGTNGNPVPEGECYAYEQFGRIYLHPTKVGSGKISIRMVGGGDHVGGGDNPTGGMEVTREFSIISRAEKSSNGGWL